MPTEPNPFVYLIRAVAPVAGTFLTTIGGIAIAKIVPKNHPILYDNSYMILSYPFSAKVFF